MTEGGGCDEVNQNSGTTEETPTTKNSGIRWLLHGAVGLTCGTASYAIISSDWLVGSVSWSFFAFLFFYTVALFLIFTYFTKHPSDCSTMSLRPNGLTRLRSYLTFLPITTIIPHAECKESLRNPEATANELSENELSIRINLQKDLVIEAILEEYIAPWYTKISSSTIFLKQCRDILQLVFSRLGEKIKQVDRNDLAKEAIQTVHLHWKEYCEASENAASTEDILKRFKFVHPFLQDTTEVARNYEQLVCRLLEDLVIPDLQSQVLCQFLSGILVKSFFLYYAEMITQPSWINSNIITLLRSGSLLVELPGYSSQNSSAPVTPQPERSPKPMAEEMSPFPTTPTPSESSWVGVESPKSTSSLEKAKEERCFFGKESQSPQELNTVFIGEDCQTGYGTKFTEHDEKQQETCTRISSKCIVTSVTTALSGVLPTTTLPLLPSGCFGYEGYKKIGVSKSNTQENIIALKEAVLNTKSPLSPSAVLKTASDSNKKTIETDSSTSNCPKEKSTEPFVEQSDNNSPIIESHPANDKNDSNIAKTPTHYYSFDEANRRKSNHQFLDTGTLSVDGTTDASRIDRSSTHHLKLEGCEIEAGTKPTRSPVYEEPEDFATSIAKLRSLLEQRDSKKSLTGDDRNVTPEVDNSLCSASENSVEGYSSAVKDELIFHKNEPFEDMLAVEKLLNLHNEARDRKSEEDDSLKSMPELKCRFFNISIPKVESCHDHGGQYDFYCIQYEGVYFEEVYDDDEPPRVILRTTTVKRRFKEFVMLQSKLEEHSSLKPHLKGIKAPNRWLNLSFSKADAAATRKAMLEKYLHQLCYHPILGIRPEILQFMAYGDDGFYPDPLDIHDPKHLLSDRLEKLAKKFTGVMNTLKDVLPSFESNPPSPRFEAEFPVSDDGTTAQGIPSFEFSERLSPEERDATQELAAKALVGPKWLETLVPLTNRENVDEESNFDTDGKGDTSDVQPSTEPAEDLSEEVKICSTYPLAAALTQLLCDVLWLPNCRPHNVSVSTFMSISGKSIENYVQETIDVFLSEEALLGYLEWVNRSLKAEMDISQDMPFDTCSELDLKNCLKRRIPAWVRWMWGRSRLDVTIERITGFLQNPIINHDLVLSLSELMFSKIV